MFFKLSETSSLSVECCPANCDCICSKRRNTGYFILTQRNVCGDSKAKNNWDSFSDTSVSDCLNGLINKSQNRHGIHWNAQLQNRPKNLGQFWCICMIGINIPGFEPVLDFVQSPVEEWESDTFSYETYEDDLKALPRISTHHCYWKETCW